jgi:hypothetical protein
MMKPGMGSYYSFKELFDKYSKEAGKQQYLIPYFISAHPGTTDEHGEHGALDQVQPLQARSGAELLPIAARQCHHHVLHREKPAQQGESPGRGRVRGERARRRRLHKALLRYHDPAGWPMIREALLEMGKGHLIGNGPDCLVPPEGRGEAKAERSRSKGLKPALTRHSAITHQRSNGAGNKAARSDWCRKAPATSRNGGKAGNGKPVGSQLQKGAGMNPVRKVQVRAQARVLVRANRLTRQDPDPCRLS